jgi:hypothetical protein
VQVDDEPGGGLRLRPNGQRALVFAVGAAILLALSRLPEDRTLAFAASTTLVGFVMLVGAAVAGSAARTAALVRRVRRRGFVGSAVADGGGSYREAPRQPLVLVDGEPLQGPFRIEARRDRATRAAAGYKVYLVGARELVVVADVTTADEARALVRRLESALGQALTERPEVEREFRFDDESPAAWWLTIGFTVGYLALAFALSHWLFARADLVARREPVAPLVLVPFGAVAYWAWSRVGAAAARARLIAEFGLRR